MIHGVVVSPMGALWVVKAIARQSLTAFSTQAEAVADARSLLASTGGGELVVTDASGTVVLRELVHTAHA